MIFERLRRFLKVQQNESAGIPDLIGKSAVGLHLLVAERDIRPRRRADGQGESDRIRPVFLRNFQGIDHIPLGLGHLLFFRVPDQRVDVELAEGDFLHELQAHHDHSRAPEEQDVKAHDHQVIGVEAAEVLGVVGPTQSRKWPERRAEPGVQDVGVCAKRAAATFRAACGRLASDHHFTAGFAIPRWNSMSPPELARDAPVVDIDHPVEVNLLVIFRSDPYASVFDHADGRFSKRFHLHEPLRRKPGLDDRLAPLARPDTE